MAVLSSLPDDELVLLLKGGSEPALTALYLRYWDKLLAVANNRLDDPEEAEECVQDVFFRLWQRREDLQLSHSLSTYLAVAVKYRVINALDKLYRLRNRMEGSYAELASYQVFSAEDYLLEKELKQQIAASINKLPEKCRIVFKLSREQGLTHKQIAGHLGISEKTVEAHISKAMKDIRGNLAVTVPAFVAYIISQHL
jgi:RNA polymerase sigma-70 factor (family 1)